jgi:hypothetical protein
MVRPQYLDLPLSQLPSLPPLLNSPQKLHNKTLSSVPSQYPRHKRFKTMK